jgi:adenosylcobinamide kinase / adenosylcobinamide-phosphate guanylyltransferase
MRTLILGGARSGKSGYAETLAERGGAPVRYLATAALDPADADFGARVAAHRARRPSDWRVLETAHADLPALLDGPGATLVDDIGTWLTGRIDARHAWASPRGTVAAEMDALVHAVETCRGRLILVSPEVGWGVVPATRSGRLFRDELGSLNQRLAAACDEVFLVVAGLPMRLK